jgi:DNA-binding transcriptional LysR family regulator
MMGRMEEELGFKLFVRTKRKVALTEAGKTLANDCRIILRHAEEAIVRAKRAANGETGTLRVAFIPWADFTTVFSEIFRAFGEAVPDVTVDFHSMLSLAATQALEEGRVDVAFVIEPAQPLRGIESELVLADELVAVLSKDHELAGRKVIPMARLSTEPHIVVAPDRIVPRDSAMRRLYAQHGFELKARHMVDHPQTTLALVAAGAGVSVVPASYQNVERHGVAYRKVRPTGRIKMIAAWKTTNRTPLVETFVRVLRQARAGTIAKRRGR